MSEYQYYEWQTIDRLLTEDEQEEVERLSSHITVSASHAVVTYSWGDFKHNAESVLARYFDAHLYMANWGSRRLMFRLPKTLVDGKAVAPYCVDRCIHVNTAGHYHVMDIRLDEEGGGDWLECEGLLSSLVPLRNDIIQGDLRSLYLAWLKAMEMSDGGWREDAKDRVSRQFEPPVPPGLKDLSPALRRFVKVFEVDSCLVSAAAEARLELSPPPQIDLRRSVGSLPRQECDEFLTRLASGDPVVGMQLKKRLMGAKSPAGAAKAARRSVSQIFDLADKIRKERDRRHREETEKKRLAEMADLTEREESIWREIEKLIAVKKPKEYDQAVRQLTKLKELYVHRRSLPAYRETITTLIDHHRTLSGLKYRIRAAKLLG